MRKLSDNELIQCRFVSDLFEYSTTRNECSSKVFIKAFVFSSICKRIFSNAFLLDSLDVVAAYETIKKEKKLTRGNDVFPSYVMSWIGFIMVYCSCATKIPIYTIYGTIKPEELYSLYESYHSLDNDLAVSRIAEAKELNINLNDVELMKRIKFRDRQK